MMTISIQIIIAALTSALILALEHWGPLEKIAGTLHPIVRYIIGVLALILPLTVLLILWAEWSVLLALWTIVAAGGLAVIGMYALDHYIEVRDRANVSEKAELRLKNYIEGER